MDDLKRHLQESLNDPAFRKVWAETEPEYQVVRQLIATRLNKGLTQKELAKLVGTTQSTIARIENGGQNVSIRTLSKLASALESEVKITLQPR
ncbi:Antitoxin HigA [Pelotomaculum schinkii]|uniref:Antitoxin HigA n=1 Tax=Pelotomaculum schinkii TaxID=78350 RepID=A0A4Y7R7C7_9FIRM|nr:helix-turn-helix transcriptional regulator [Pelotomaculum schinkii]TEB04747.1 Antitoxin HigA [Pelotomaculum schinkii]